MTNKDLFILKISIGIQHCKQAVIPYIKKFLIVEVFLMEKKIFFLIKTKFLVSERVAANAKILIKEYLPEKSYLRAPIAGVLSQNLTQKEASQVLDVSESTIKRGRKRLREEEETEDKAFRLYHFYLQHFSKKN